jgi:hypothetical protein
MNNIKTHGTCIMQPVIPVRFCASAINADIAGISGDNYAVGTISPPHRQRIMIILT